MVVWIPDDDDIDRLVTATRELILAFPEAIPEEEDEVSFNLPGYLVEAVRAALNQLKE